MVIKGFNITCGEDIEDSRKLIYSNNPSPSRTKFPTSLMKISLFVGTEKKLKG